MSKLKIVFHIPRMNWYRVLSPLIDETIRRGHIVECWHQSGAKALGENCPNNEKVPEFEKGIPVIIDYEKPEDIVKLITQRNPDVVIDLYPPRYSNSQWDGKIWPNKPYWLLVDLPPSDCLLEIKNDSELYACDAFAVCNEYYLNASIKYGGQDKQKLLEYVLSHKDELGEGAAEWISNQYMYQLKEKQINYIKENSIIVGNSGFDGYGKIDKERVRKSFGISPTQRIVVLLPCPFGYDFSSPWEQLFVRSSIFHRLYWIYKTKRLDCLVRAVTTTSNKDLLIALRKFCDSNNALLVAKLRHSRNPSSELRRNCHMMIGEIGYYPHTAVELFSIADLVVGHYSFASIEALALGIPYLNINIPYFPKKYYCDTRTPIHNCDAWPGAVWEMEASDAVRDLPGKSIDDFCIDQFARQSFLEKFSSWPISGASVRILNYLESKLKERSGGI
ncbi:MAG: hypothetical protein V2B20_02780 [Pseudomonadota bacterium]